jgi:O-antigen ligase
MPPTLALLLCIIFVVVLLWIEHKRYLGESNAMWVPTLWVLYSGSRPVSQWFNVGFVSSADMSVESGNPIERGILSLLIMLGLMVLARRKMNWRQIITDNRWFLILFLYMLVSVVWSDYPFVSLKRYIKNAGTVIMALVLLSEPSPCEAMRSVFVRTAYVLIPFSVILVKYFPRWGRGYTRWGGVEVWMGATMTKNTLGVLCVISAFFLFWAIVRRWQGKQPRTVRYETLADLVVLGLTLWLLNGSKSASSLGVFMLGLATFVVLRRLRAPVRHLGGFFLAGAGLVVLLSALSSGSPMGLAASVLGRDRTLTGRTDEIWAPLFKIALENPLLGVGYGGFWVKPVEGLDVNGIPINEAHNGYLDVFIQLGAVGIILFVPVWVSFFRRAQREFEYDRDWASFRISILVVALLHNITETSWLGDTCLLWALFVCLFIVYPDSRAQESEAGLRQQESPATATREEEATFTAC